MQLSGLRRREENEIHELRNGSTWYSNPRSLDCESGFLPVSYRASQCTILWKERRIKFMTKLTRVVDLAFPIVWYGAEIGKIEQLMGRQLIHLRRGTRHK